MPKKQSYSEKYRDPRWQKKRLEVMELAHWKCQCCGTETKELHVHHPRYRKNKDIWDYSTIELRALCLDCHSTLTDAINDVRSCSAWLSKPALDNLRMVGFVLDNLPPPYLAHYLSIIRSIADYALKSYENEINEDNTEM